MPPFIPTMANWPSSSIGLNCLGFGLTVGLHAVFTILWATEGDGKINTNFFNLYFYTVGNNTDQ